jgi:hypothetical protein
VGDAWKDDNDNNNDDDGTVALTLSISTTPLERQVQFHPFGTNYYIETLDEYTDEEIHACWYKDDEIGAIKADNLRTIRDEASGRLQLDVDTVRGLEAQKHQGYMSLRNFRETSISAVLTEQYRQRQRGMTNPDLLRDSYSCISIRASYRARRAAQLDAQEVLRVQNDLLSWRLIQIEDTTRTCCFFNPPMWFFAKGTQNAMVDVQVDL